MEFFNGKPFCYFEDWLRSELERLTPQYMRQISNVHSFLVPYEHVSEDITTVCVTEFLNAKPINKLGILILVDKIIRQKCATTPNLAAEMKKYLQILFYDLRQYRNYSDFPQYVNDILWAWEESKTCLNQIEDLKFIFNNL
ncbi:uncharacterized protein LOC130667055 [Microplitis mediator]|uniref:uncharacterized protein LOC130667054 n=1 Tax=Microplitis mediator TaxID=375433 RepID=UPI002553A343|nr:uncharacterized protein LOC130667054 [Microplitis mediator]XP_057324431.1 uncharacterized protein LOC130667055 [Microplitis mediator]